MSAWVTDTGHVGAGTVRNIAAGGRDAMGFARMPWPADGPPADRLLDEVDAALGHVAPALLWLDLPDAAPLDAGS